MSSVYTLLKIREEVKKISLSEEHYNRIMNLIDKIKDIELSSYNQALEYCDCLDPEDFQVDFQRKINSSYKELIIELSELTK